MTGSKRKLVESMLERSYGVKLGFKNVELLEGGEGKIRVTNRETIDIANKLKRIQTIGLYVAKLVKGDIALSMEGSHMLCNEITKNIIEIDEYAIKRWMEASPIEIGFNHSYKYIVGKYRGRCVGSARFSQGKLYPQVPKERRLTGRS